jgi:hypothetical protein
MGDKSEAWNPDRSCIPTTAGEPLCAPTAPWGFRGLGPLSRNDKCPLVRTFCGQGALIARGRYWDRTSDLFRVN